MMVTAPPKIRIRSLPELDALVAQRVTGERPNSQWEHRATQFVFASIEEAVDSLSDSYYQNFADTKEEGNATFTEIKEYRRYSSDPAAVWDVVGMVACDTEPLHVSADGEGWVAKFGRGPHVAAETAPVAICVAALQAKGVVVEMALATT